VRSERQIVKGLGPTSHWVLGKTAKKVFTGLNVKGVTTRGSRRKRLWGGGGEKKVLLTNGKPKSIAIKKEQKASSITPKGTLKKGPPVDKKSWFRR